MIENVRHGVHGDSLPTSERQIRPLARLAPADQPTAWQEAVARYGEPTGRQVATGLAMRVAYQLGRRVRLFV